MTELIETAWGNAFTLAVISLVDEALKIDKFETITPDEASWQQVKKTVREAYRTSEHYIFLNQSLANCDELDRRVSTRMEFLIGREWPHYERHVERLTDEFFSNNGPTYGNGVAPYCSFVARELGFEHVSTRTISIILKRRRQLEIPLSPANIPMLDYHLKN